MARHFDNLPEQRAYRRTLRLGATPAERRLWKHLRRKRLDGWRWRRQYGIGPFIVDFYCPEARLGVEVDGAVHDDPSRAAYDAERERWLADVADVRMLRVTNREVFKRIEDVVGTIRGVLDEGRPPPGLPPLGGGES
ncbi:MAG: endonuclease domain-containing protein [Bacteroidota bacterium]